MSDDSPRDRAAGRGDADAVAGWRGAALSNAKAKDTITGFEGIVTGLVKYMTGCNQVLLAPPVKDDGGYRESQWFDDSRVTVLTEAAVTIADPGDHPRPDAPAPVR